MLTNKVAAESELRVCVCVCMVGVVGGGENATQWGPHKTPNELR